MSYTILSHLFPHMLSLAVSPKCVLDVLVFTMSLTTVYPFARPLTNTLPHRRPTVPNLTSPCRPPLRAVVHACMHTHTHTHSIRIRIPLVFSPLLAALITFFAVLRFSCLSECYVSTRRCTNPVTPLYMLRYARCFLGYAVLMCA